jgi:hypothetical protein
MKLKSVLCGAAFAGLTAGSALVFAQQTTPPDQPSMAPSVVTPPAAVVAPSASSGTVVTTPSSPAYIWVPPYSSVPMYSEGPSSQRLHNPSTGIYHGPDVG